MRMRGKRGCDGSGVRLGERLCPGFVRCANATTLLSINALASALGPSCGSTGSSDDLHDGMAPAHRFRHRRFMLELSRETIAFGIIGVLLVVGAPWLGYTLRRRKRERLRRRGIKTYGH